jgi:xylan 1,4-beta-xylosidase
MLEQLHTQQLVTRVDGDGAGDMVNAVATGEPDGRLAILLWNGTVDVSKAGGDRLLDRHIELTFADLPAAGYRLRHRRLDEQHSDLNATAARVLDGSEWPDEAGWRALREGDRLVDLEPPAGVQPVDRTLRLTFEMPMPSLSLIELVPE